MMGGSINRAQGRLWFLVALSCLVTSSCSSVSTMPVGGGSAQEKRACIDEFSGPGDFGFSVTVEPENRPSTYEELVEFATFYAQHQGWKGVRAGKFILHRWKPDEREVLVVPLTVDALKRSGVKVGDAEWFFVFAEK